MFDEGIVESVLRNKHMNECTEQFDADNALKFISIIPPTNNLVNELNYHLYMYSYQL